MQIITRKATLKDLEQLKKFQQGLVKFERPFDPTLKKGEIEYYDLQKLLGSAEAYVVVAEIEKKVIGCGFGEIRNDDLSYTNISKFGYVGLMYVEEKYRGEGAGRMIIESVINWFKEKKISEVRLKVYANNKNAIEAYRKNGFQDFVLEMRKTLP